MAFLDRAVGIDLGTTNSEIAWLPPHERDVILHADRFGRRTIPSAVAWDEGAAAYVVGHAARARRGAALAPVESIKRKMGRRVTVPLGPSALTPEEVSSKILAELRDRMRETLAQPTNKRALGVVELRVSRAVITVPAYFDAPQIEATRAAGELAGLEVLGILQEPTAAAIYHTWKRRLGDGHFLVYDLGGGTFDVTVLRCTGGEYQVLAIDGDNFLGGDDFDRRFAERLRSALATRGYALDLDVARSPDDARRFARLVHLAQEVKEALSTAPVVPLSRSDLFNDKAGEPVSYEDEVGREDYERTIEDLVEATLVCADRALERAREVADVRLEDIDHVILVGGSTRVPLVVRRVTERFCRAGQEPLRDDVDTCVALGAAIHAAHLGGTILGDEARGARVRVTTPLVAEGEKLRVALAFEEVPSGAAHVVAWHGEHALGDAPLVANAARLELALGEIEEIQATLALQTALGAPVAELPLPLARGDLRPRPTALSRASVVAKDVALEVVRAGRRDRRVLIPRGTGLPTHATQLFFTADQAGAIVLRVLQNRLPIKTLVVDVPRDLPVGTPVELSLRCDESMRIEARATIGTQEVEAQIDPAPNEEEASDVEALLERAEKARRELWGGLAAGFGREADPLVAGIRDVLRTDPDKLAELCRRLSHLVEEYHGGAGEVLVPPFARMEEGFDVLRRVVYRAVGDLMGEPRDKWEQRIDALHERAMAAHRAADAPSWRRIWNEVQALAETAYQEEFTALRLDDPAYVRRRLVATVLRAERAQKAAREHTTSGATELAALQRAEQARVGTWLAESVVAPLRAVEAAVDTEEAGELRRRLDRIDAELDHVEVAIERIPSLGLVTDRGPS